MRNLHLIILQEFGIEARRLLREWERLWLRSSDYKNHRIFSLRCIHKELIPVSIRLKSTLDTPKARQIIRKAEKDLLQARIKAINNILDQVDRETQDCRAKLASIISQERLEQCQHFINKVSELRFNKVKQRQINKLNHLVSKKEGNITNNITLNRQVQSPPNSRNPTPATQPSPEACATSREGTPSSTHPNRSSQGSSNEEPNPKWVINLSNKPLTPAQRSVLAKGPNFVVTPRQPPNLEYITAIEAACTKLSQQDAEELRADVNRVLRSSHPPKPNLTKAQNIALRELKRDRDRIVLTADKGVAMVVMDKQDYINKANQLLNQNTYKVISKDPTTTIKNKLINILKVIKTKTGLGSYSYKAMYPTGCVPP